MILNILQRKYTLQPDEGIVGEFFSGPYDVFHFNLYWSLNQYLDPLSCFTITDPTPKTEMKWQH